LRPVKKIGNFFYYTLILAGAKESTQKTGSPRLSKQSP